jgi:hypothetical protein
LLVILSPHLDFWGTRLHHGLEPGRDGFRIATNIFNVIRAIDKFPPRNLSGDETVILFMFTPVNPKGGTPEIRLGDILAHQNAAGASVHDGKIGINILRTVVRGEIPSDNKFDFIFHNRDNLTLF